MTVKVNNDLMGAEYISKDGSRYSVNLIPNRDEQEMLWKELVSKRVDIVMQPASFTDSIFSVFATLARSLAWLAFAIFAFFGGAFQTGGRGGMMNPFDLGKSHARIIKPGDTEVTFADVAGCDNAKLELMEIVDFLKHTSRYSELGAKIPKGALLVGPPGTGKTLLGRAVAGEAGVPFFSVSASEFVEIFAGIGAARVRDLFEQAKKSAPCIVFIDELDAVGRQRSAGFGQGNDEREQTVNQLLSEMDGFQSNNGVVVLAATNRADILDQALIRPGRFDRQIQVDLPDVAGREAILKVHAKKKTLAASTDLAAVARLTPGMSGADLANLLNEAAIISARQNKVQIELEDIYCALERITLGLEKKNAEISDKKRTLLAYHEAGHAVLGAMMNDFDTVEKVSIVSRGMTGGSTTFMPSEERLQTGLYSREFLENRMCVALGGRIAEELVNGKGNVTTGASEDFKQCTDIAKAMVMHFGMSTAVGERFVGPDTSSEKPFMGRDWFATHAPPISQALKETVDHEIKRLVDEQYRRGLRILKANQMILDRVASRLLQEEKVSGQALVSMINSAAQEGLLVNEALAVA